MSRQNPAAPDALVAEATVDCYNDSECVTGFYTMLEDNFAVPFQTVVLEVDVTVTEDEQITAVCTRPIEAAHPDPGPAAAHPPPEGSE